MPDADNVDPAFAHEIEDHMRTCANRRSRAIAAGMMLGTYQRIVELMVKHAAVRGGEEVDAANLAMILWSLRRRRDDDG